MRRAFLVLTLAAAMPLFADDAAVKRQLVSELLEVIDVKALTRTSFETASGLYGEGDDAESMRAFNERLYLRIDYVKLADEVYAPLFSERFNAEELKELIAFFKSKHGQKLAQLLPEIGLGGAIRGSRFIEEAVQATQEELEKEDAAKHPWKSTLSDMRSIATAVEARATDTNEYPHVSFDELPAIISPTYIRTVPQVDAWGTPYFFVATGEHYRLVSAGADKHFDWSSQQLDLNDPGSRLSDTLDADIIFQDGNFLQMPKEGREQ